MIVLLKRWVQDDRGDWHELIRKTGMVGFPPIGMTVNDDDLDGMKVVDLDYFVVFDTLFVHLEKETATGPFVAEDDDTLDFYAERDWRPIDDLDDLLAEMHGP